MFRKPRVIERDKIEPASFKQIGERALVKVERSALTSTERIRTGALAQVEKELCFPSELAVSTLSVGIQDQKSQNHRDANVVKNLSREVKRSENDLMDFKKNWPFVLAGGVVLFLSAMVQDGLQAAIFVGMIVATGLGPLTALKILQSRVTRSARREITNLKENIIDRTELIEGMHEAMAELPAHLDIE